MENGWLDGRIALFGIHVNSGVETSNQIDFNLTNRATETLVNMYTHTHTHQTDEKVNKTLSVE